MVMSEGAVITLVMNKDGSLIASGSAYGQVKIWKYATGQCLRMIMAHREAITALCFTATNDVVSGAADGTIK